MPTICKRKNEEYAAVFRERSDGDWDFVAMVSLENMPLLSQADSEQALTLLTTIAAAIEEEGDRSLIDFFDDSNVPSVYEKEVPA